MTTQTAMLLMLDCRHIARETADMNNIDPATKLAMLDALGVYASHLVAYTDELYRDSAAKASREIQNLIADVRHKASA